MNCLKKTKISEKDETIAINNKDDLFKEIDESLKELREKEPSLVPQNMTAEDFATTDDAVITTSLTLTDEEISKVLHRLRTMRLKRSRMMTKNW